MMIQLPKEFIHTTKELMGEERFGRYLHSFEEDVPVSIRLNPSKMEDERWKMEDAVPVPWCRNAYYLAKRPNFTFDPLFHAGCYYVQEAASMFLDEVLRQHLPSNIRLQTSLDLCAAPGGKSTLLRSALPADCVLYSNEPMRNRASILLENVTKWGYENHLVTNLFPKDYRKSKMKFDLILCDVPCSGEGMFRKDEATIKEWNPQNVDKCWQLQREIVSDAWQCLNEGGILIYSTCTFNTKENEENIRWILSEFDAEVLPIATKPEWNITGSLLEGFNEPVYRFIPGITRSEGLFMCVLRKGGNSKTDAGRGKTDKLKTMTSDLNLQTTDIQAELTYAQALAYLRHEAIVLPPDTPRGLVEVCFMGHPLGLVKNIGNRANNLYPKEWRIKTTHVPQEYEPVLW
jgi:16S rRNA C967 or C1407 C5-methylase (RsmB/RsmF family)